ncbi:MAG: thermonuclease family protein [Planctomycetaceae bacterium]
MPFAQPSRRPVGHRPGPPPFGRIPRSLRRRHLLAALLASAVAAVAESCRRQVGGDPRGWTVAFVHDGDTVTARSPDGVDHRIRMLGIDAPELAQPHGRESRAALAALVEGRTVQIDARGHDQHGRLLARLSVAGEDVNARLVRDGHAWVFGRIAPDPELVALEAEARRGRRGLWSAERPLDPSAWRDQHPRQP